MFKARSGFHDGQTRETEGTQIKMNKSFMKRMTWHGYE
jgi:hypothetical protein